MEEVLLEQVVQKLKGLGQKRWIKKIDGEITSYSISTSNFKILIKKYSNPKDHNYDLYDLKLTQKEYGNSSIFFDSSNANTKKLLVDLFHELESKEATKSKENYRELLLEGLLEELK